MKFLIGQWCENVEISSYTRDKLPHCAEPMAERALTLSVLKASGLGTLLWSTYQVAWKVSCSKRHVEQEGLQQIQAALQADLPLGLSLSGPRKNLWQKGMNM